MFNCEQKIGKCSKNCQFGYDTYADYEKLQNAKCQNLLRSCPENRQIDISLLIG
jgi:hypothetical protein